MRPGSTVLLNRLVSFSVNAIGIARRLRRDDTDRHVASQLARAATSVAAHYAEATEAESRHDFIHKMKGGLKGLRECDVWLRIIAGVAPASGAAELAAECDELIAIFVASIRSARAKRVAGGRGATSPRPRPERQPT
jgi:four helix bundle protein